MNFWEFYAAHPVLGTIALFCGVAAAFSFGPLVSTYDWRAGGKK